MLLTLLPTKLYFRERSHLADYVSDSQVYNLLNQAYAKVCKKPHKIAGKIQTVEIFNNAVLLCTIVLHDDEIPSEHYFEYWKYTKDVQYKDKPVYTARLTMWMVYGLLSLVTSEADRLKSLLISINENNCTSGYPVDDDAVIYRQAICEFIDEARAQHLQLTCEDFPLTLLSTAENDQWRWNGIKWKECTEDFETDTIDGILALWTKKKDKLFVLKKIWKAFEEDEKRIQREIELENELPF